MPPLLRWSGKIRNLEVFSWAPGTLLLGVVALPPPANFALSAGLFCNAPPC